MFNEKSIKLFGRVAVRASNHSSSEFKTAQCRALLVHLAMSPGEEQSRKRLAEALWPEEGQGATGNRLSVALYHLRHLLDSLDEGFASCIVATRDSLVLVDTGIAVDFGQFRSSVQAARLTDDVALKRLRYQDAVAKYSGGLAPEVAMPWLVTMQLETERMFQEAVLWLANDFDARSQRDKAMHVLSEALTVTTTLEPAAELLTRWHLDRGEVHLAKACATRIRRSLVSIDVSIGPRMLGLIQKINSQVEPSSHAIVTIEESVYTVALAKHAETNVVAEKCMEYGARPTRDGNGFYFRNPLVAMEAAQQVSSSDVKTALVLHTAIMATTDSVSSGALAALAQAEPSHVSCTEACAALLKQHGVDVKKWPKRRLWRLPVSH